MKDKDENQSVPLQKLINLQQQQKEEGNKRLQNSHKTINKMAFVSSYLSVITLND